MPKHIEVVRDLVRINITSQSHEVLIKRKRHKEPLYRVVDRMLSTYLDNDASDWEEMYHQQVEATKNWKTKYESLRDWANELKKECGYQQILD